MLVILFGAIIRFNKTSKLIKVVKLGNLFLISNSNDYTNNKDYFELEFIFDNVLSELWKYQVNCFYS